MATNWPTSRDTFTNPSSGDTLDNPSHAAQHANINDAVEAMQAHAGLVLVKPSGATNGTVGANGAVTINNTVSSVTVSGVFSSTFDHYFIVLSGGTASGTAVLRCQLGSTTTGYYLAGNSIPYTGSATLEQLNNGALFTPVGVQRTTQKIAAFHLYNPNRAEITEISGTYMDTANMLAFGGYLSGTTQFTAFTISPASGTMSGGTIRVYGYNNG